MSELEEPRFLERATVLWSQVAGAVWRLGRDSRFGRRGFCSGLGDEYFFYGGGDIYDIAAAYAYHIAESQAFLDGNKRTAAACALTFLAGCGVAVPRDDGQLYSAMIAISARRMNKTELAGLLRTQFPRS